MLPYVSIIRMEFIIFSRYSTGHGFQLFLQVLFLLLFLKHIVELPLFVLE